MDLYSCSALQSDHVCSALISTPLSCTVHGFNALGVPAAFYPYNNPIRFMLLLPSSFLFSDGEAEAQRDQVTCLGLHNC